MTVCRLRAARVDWQRSWRSPESLARDTHARRTSGRVHGTLSIRARYVPRRSRARRHHRPRHPQARGVAPDACRLLARRSACAAARGTHEAACRRSTRNAGGARTVASRRRARNPRLGRACAGIGRGGSAPVATRFRPRLSRRPPREWSQRQRPACVRSVCGPAGRVPSGGSVSHLACRQTTTPSRLATQAQGRSAVAPRRPPWATTATARWPCPGRRRRSATDWRGTGSAHHHPI